MNVRATDGDQTANLDQRLGRVVNPQIEDRVAPGASGGFRLDDQNRRRLTAADVAAFSLRRVERCKESIDQLALGAGVRLRHRRPDRVLEHHVGLHGKSVPDDVSGFWNCSLTGVRRDAAERIDHRDLPNFTHRIGGEQARERVGRALARAHQVESELAVRRIGERLRRDCAHAGFRPRDDRAGGEVMRLHGNAELPSLRIARDNRVSVNERIDNRRHRMSS